ncbi:MAG: hypothetical protein IJL14_01035 [Selenomonadaceae bacterium]|nr:hypothetical protein [Selenomonadaceae bacterium]
MNYAFDVPSQEFMEGLLLGNALNHRMEPPQSVEQSPSPEPTSPVKQTEPAEQRNGAAIVNAAVDNALNIPNPYQIQFQRGLLDTKQKYYDAKTDEERQTAHAHADYLRDVANAAGIDISGYGEGVSLDDARKNFASQEARDIMGALSGDYSMNANQYYDEKYFDALLRGLSPRRAKRLAEAQAQEYQYNHARYLDGLFNSYGLDGRVVTPLGNQLLGSFAQSDPTTANFYSQVYPNQKEAYNQDNNVTNLLLGHGFDLERLAKTNEYNQGMAYLNQKLNDQSYGYRSRIDEGRDVRKDERKFKYGQATADAQQKRDQENYVFQSDVDDEREMKKEQRSFALKERQLAQQIDLINKYLPENERPDAVAAMFGFTRKEAKGESGDKEIKTMLESLNKAQERITAQRNAIQNQFKDNLEGMPPEVQAQLAQLDADWKEINDTIMGLNGLRGDYEDFSEDDEAKNVANIAQILQIGAQNGASEDQQFQAVRKWVPKDRTDLYVRGLIKKARGG